MVRQGPLFYAIHWHSCSLGDVLRHAPQIVQADRLRFHRRAFADVLFNRVPVHAICFTPAQDRQKIDPSGTDLGEGLLFIIGPVLQMRRVCLSTPQKLPSMLTVCCRTLAFFLVREVAILSCRC